MELISGFQTSSISHVAISLSSQETHEVLKQLRNGFIERLSPSPTVNKARRIISLETWIRAC